MKMELKISIKKCETFAGELYECGRCLLLQEQKLEELQQNASFADEECERVYIHSIQRKREELHRQLQSIRDMSRALELICTEYADCEEQILEADEPKRKLFEEKPGLADLKEWNRIPIEME